MSYADLFYTAFKRLAMKLQHSTNLGKFIIYHQNLFFVKRLIRRWVFITHSVIVIVVYYKCYFTRYIHQALPILLLESMAHDYSEPDFTSFEDTKNVWITLTNAVTLRCQRITIKKVTSDEQYFEWNIRYPTFTINVKFLIKIEQTLQTNFNTKKGM